jgi:hypothetical protein
MSTGASTPQNHRDLVTLVLVEALGSSLTPFVPLPFVDDYLLERLLRRITRKVAERGGYPVSKPVEKAIVHGYVKSGATSLGGRAITAAARFVVRKVAVVLDVKKSHDVFGEAIAYALALDVAVGLRAIHDGSAVAVGAAVFRSTQSVGSAALELITRAGRDAFAANAGAPESSRLSRVSEAIGRQVDEARVHLERAMRYELSQMR